MAPFSRCFSTILASLLCAAALRADDAKHISADAPMKRPESPADTNAIEHKEKIGFYRSRLRDHRLFMEDRRDNPCAFVEDPLIRFANPVSQNGDGLMFLWTDRGRPVALMKSYYHMPRQIWGRVFVSLATRPMEMRVGNQPLWKPRLPGISFKPLDAVMPPADKAPARLVQMRNIAKEFQVVDNWGMKDPTDWQLRLLPKPLYRYQVPEEEVTDGALFGYVLAGPEALLLLEARQTPSGLEWHYAVSRCTQYRLTFSRNDLKVAEIPRLDEWPITETFFGIRVPMTDYPFGDPFGTAKPGNEFKN